MMQSRGLQLAALQPATGIPGQRITVLLRVSPSLDIRSYRVAIGNVETSVDMVASRPTGEIDLVELAVLVPYLSQESQEAALSLTVYATSATGAMYGETATFLYSPTAPMPQLPASASKRGGSSSDPQAAPAPPSTPPLASSSRSPLSSPQTPTFRAAPSRSKAELSIEGELNTMAMGWSREDYEARRRLVQFWRQQEGNVINCTFKAISPDDYVPTAIVISCIFEERKNECFVTSVDVIYLLEALVGVRFTVEEKNRIRRNLEGFKPVTVSKAKANSTEFFRLIMSFGSPKPRSIEKDLKVFAWATLSSALKKIISKYSAVYASPDDPLPALGNEAAVPGSRLKLEPASPNAADQPRSPAFPSSAPPSYPSRYTGVPVYHPVPSPTTLSPRFPLPQASPTLSAGRSQ